MEEELRKTWVQRDFGLDLRLVKALSKLGFIYPTPVQSKTIPIALQGKDVLVKARTGSGKTVAFSLPVLHKLLSSKDTTTSKSQSAIFAVILAPTKELCKQIETHMQALIYYCRDDINICALIDDNQALIKHRVSNRPDIVISTPTKLAQLSRTNIVDLSSTKCLVIDEADLVLSFGYTEDVQFITSNMPKIFQGFFISATLSPELDKFKRVVLHNPVVLKIEDSATAGHLHQFFLQSTEKDKFLILYVFLKLGLLQGKGLIFVNDVEKAYRLKLFLQQFFLPASVLNDKLPLASRLHILDEFNRGVSDLLIATDRGVDQGQQSQTDLEDDEEGELEGENEGGDEDDEGDDEEEGEEEEEEEEEDEKEGSEPSEASEASEAEGDGFSYEYGEEGEKPPPTLKGKGGAGKRRAVQKEEANDDGYGVARGLDFQNVSFLINFDFPPSTASYTHRIGRTARGGASGTALSFVSLPDPSSRAGDGSLRDSETCERDSRVLSEVRLAQPRLGPVDGDNVLAAMGCVHEGEGEDQARMQPAPLLFNMAELESFRYRVEDTFRSVTSAAVKEFRVAEIKRELVNSQKLKTFFSENPEDYKILRHDLSVSHPIKQKEHLKNVPTYLVPPSLRSLAQNQPTKKKRRRGGSAEKGIKRSRERDPLRNLEGGEEEQEGEKAVPAEDRVFSTGEVSALGKDSLSGRKLWKMKHKKGQFNEKAKAQKKNSHRISGTFTKSKKYH